MCGIFGAIEWSAKLEPERVVRATNSLQHRGPDESGFLFDNVEHHLVEARTVRFFEIASGKPWQLGFGHRRLSILDLTCGQQPMTDSSGEWSIVFNGEIYNHMELRKQLAAGGERFLTDHSDTETLLLAFAKWGASVLPKLNGMFAAAIYHRDTGRLWLIRDRFGKKPLYLHHGEGRLVFASELKAIVSYLGASPSLDLDAVGDYIMRGYIHAPRSIFQGIGKVPAASVVEINLNTTGGAVTSSRRYWDFRPPATVDESRSEHDWLAELEDLLSDAVKIRLLSDVPVGAFLSGGVDSAVVCALARKHVSEPLRAFTIGSDDLAHDETADAAEVASMLGLRHVAEKCRLAPEFLLPNLVTTFDEPFSDLSMIPTYQVAELAARQVKVVLTGDGADEFFAGYGIFRHMTAQKPLERIPFLGGLARAIWRRLPITAPGGGFVARSFGAKGIRRYREAVQSDGMLNLLNPAIVAKIDTAWPLLDELWKQSESFDPLVRVSLLQGSTYLSDDILVKVDRATMAHSLEARSPFLDFRVAEMTARMPARLKMANGRGKWLLRKLAEKWFSKSYLEKPKRGFTMPLNRWMTRELLDDLHDLSHCDLLSRRHVESLVAMQKKGRRDYSPALWRLIVLNRWLKHWKPAPCKS